MRSLLNGLQNLKGNLKINIKTSFKAYSSALAQQAHSFTLGRPPEDHTRLPPFQTSRDNKASNTTQN